MYLSIHIINFCSMYSKLFFKHVAETTKNGLTIYQVKLNYPIENNGTRNPIPLLLM